MTTLADIPKRTFDALVEYSIKHHPVGDFLHAVLINNFMDAVCRADDENIHALHAIAVYIHNELPSAAHGSKEKFDAWLAAYEP